MHSIELDLLQSCLPEWTNIKSAVIFGASFRYWVLNKPMSTHYTKGGALKDSGP